MSPLRAITIGNFDGVHVGHVQLIDAARAAVGADGRITALSFDPHPLSVLRPEESTTRLSSFDQRRRWLIEAGADDVVRLQPTKQFLGLEPPDFLAWVTGEYRPDLIVEGDDFRFGRARAGSIQTLRQHEATHGYRTIIIDAVQATLSDYCIVRASSTMLRRLLSGGRVRDAAILLGRPYEIRAEVVRGDSRGRDLGVPTANLHHGDYVLPADGIYCGSATAPDGRRYAAAISVGTKPTFGPNPRVCEAHLIDFAGRGGEYGWTIDLQFDDWLRDQLAFEHIDLLVQQLQRDIERCRAYSLARSGPMKLGVVTPL
ncbi:MAG: riboflavin kinase [Phycisphaerales bacterium]